MNYDIIIIGGGPAGLTAAIYAKRAGKNCCVFEKDLCGGMINNSAKVENIPGFSEISGPEFAQNLTDQAEKCGVEIIYDEVKHVIKYTGLEYQFCVVTSKDEHYKSKSIILATGTKHRTLGLDKEEFFIGKGIHFCALCDGAFYKDKDVIVVGGGNSALTEALYLSEICNSVTIVQNLDYLTGDEILQKRIKDAKNIEVKLSKEIIGYLLDENCNLIGLKLKTGPIAAEGIFLCIGLVPYKDITNGMLEYNKQGFIIGSNTSGLFYAGDCEKSNVKQVVTACASGAIAATAACEYLNCEIVG